MAIFASTTLGSSDPSKAMSIKALEARAQALAAAQSKQEAPTSLPSPWQGAGLVMNQAADAFATKRADQAAAEQRQQLQSLMSGVGPEGPNPQQLAGIATRDPELGRTYMSEIAQRRQQAAQIAAQKEAAAEAARVAEAAAVNADTRGQKHPQSPLGKVTHDIGRTPTPEEAEAEIKKMTAGSPADIAAKGAARDENINLQTTATQLAEAADLLEKGIYNDSGASYRTDYGQNVPGALEGIAGTDEATTARSKRYKQILSSEVVAKLKAIKGPASNKDMDWATSTVNDPSSSKENKRQALVILRAQMDAHLKSSNQTLKEMGTTGVNVDVPAGGAAAPAAAAAAAGAAVQSVASEAEALALPPGTRFKLPDGRTGTAR